MGNAWKLHGRLRALPVALACAAMLLVSSCGGGQRPLGEVGPGDPADVFARGHRPTRSLDVEATWAAPFVRTEQPLEGFSVTVAATFPTQSRAHAIGRELAAVLTESAACLDTETGQSARVAHRAEGQIPPVAPSERAWLVSHGVPRPGGGIGWAGPRHATAAPVQVLGSTVIFTDLKSVEAYEKDDSYANPLAMALGALGGTVLEEGFFEKSIGTDLTCTGSPAAAGALGSDLADHLSLPGGFLARPPWHPGGLTAQQRHARRTYRFITVEQGRLAQSALDRNVGEVTRMSLKATRSSQEEARKLFAEIQLLSLRESLESRPDLRDDRLDPTVASWFEADYAKLAAREQKAAEKPEVLLEFPSDDELRARADEERRRGAHVGQLQMARAPSGSLTLAQADRDEQVWFGELGVAGGRVDVGKVLGTRFAVLFPTLVRFLHDGGCRELAYEVVDSAEFIAD